jgi:hypothetical protein
MLASSFEAIPTLNSSNLKLTILQFEFTFVSLFLILHYRRPTGPSGLGQVDDHLYSAINTIH